MSINKLPKDITEYQHLFLEHQLIGLAITSPQKGWLHVNDKLCDMFGYSKEEFLTMTWEKMTHPQDLAQDLEQFEQLLNANIESYILQKRFFHKDGSIVHINLSVSCVRKEDKSPEYVLALLEDITDRKKIEIEINTLNKQLKKQIEQRGLQLEEAVETLLDKERNLLTYQQELQDTQLKLTSIISSLPDMVWLKDMYGFYLACNPVFENYCGKAERDILGKTDYHFFDKEGADICKQSDMNALASNTITITKEEFIYPHDGSIGMLEVRKTPVYKSNGKLLGVLGIGRDITKNNQVKLRLQQEIEFSQGIIHAIPDLLFEVDREGTYLNLWTQQPEVSIEQRELLIGNNVKSVLSPEATKIVMEALQEADEKGFSFGKIYSIDFPDKTKWFELSVSKISEDSNRFLAIARDSTERKRAEQQIEYMAHHDTLTGLPNRLFAQGKAQEAIDFAKQNNSKAALLFLDLDGFKKINDSMGHSIGDIVLQVVAARIKNAIGKNDTISRQGGDEFLIVLSDIKGEEDVLCVIEKLLYKFERAFDVGMYSVSTSASIGVVLYPDHGETFEVLLQNADTAMYKAKENGKHTYSIYNIEMFHNLMGQYKIQNDLKDAIDYNEFVLHYQPQVNLSQHTIQGAEALIRWEHPERGMILPMDFIPLAESTGLIVQIGEWVITEACRQAALWAKEGVEITVTVNISLVQFKLGKVEEVVKKALESCGLAPQFLELELTESILIHDAKKILKSVQALKELGVKLSIDDFGTGYSSLANLKRFAVDKLKIDQSFIRDILQDKEDAAIVSTIIQMAKNLNLQTIAEGVESQEVLDAVHALGCDEVQGYYFAKPMESAAFTKYYKKFISQKLKMRNSTCQK